MISHLHILLSARPHFEFIAASIALAAVLVVAAYLVGYALGEEDALEKHKAPPRDTTEYQWHLETCDLCYEAELDKLEDEMYEECLKGECKTCGQKCKTCGQWIAR